MLLPALFHWSPRDRREDILDRGLIIGSPHVCHSTANNEDGSEWRADYICFSPTPSGAWSLSGDIHSKDGETWDLWQIRLSDGDSVEIRPDWGRWIREVRVKNSIDPGRIWWVAERAISR